MAVLNRNPWGDQSNSFEQVKQAAKPVKKAISDAAAVVATDVKQQLTGDYGQAVEQAQPAAQANQAQQGQDAAKQKQELLIQTRQNLEKINLDIKRIREERMKKQVQIKQTEEKKSQEKKMVEKKKAEPMWQKLLKGKTGSKEGNVRAGG